MDLTIYLKKLGSKIQIFEDLNCLSSVEDTDLIWVDIETEEPSDLAELANFFQLHELAVEDCFTIGHFPKLEEYNNCLFLMIRGLKSTAEIEEIRNSEELDEEYNSEKLTRGIGIFLGKNFIITHRLYEVSWLDAFLRQFKNSPEIYENFNPQDLALRICNTLSARFLRGVNYFEDEIDAIEDDIIQRPEKFDMLNLLDIKRDLNILISIARDQKTIFARLAQEPNLVSSRQIRRYYKNIEDRMSTTMQSLQRLIDNLGSVRDVYLAVSNVRLNDIMRVLAVITTLTAPLNVIAGIYGMNFSLIPLSENPFGFVAIVSLMFLMLMLLLTYFRRKKWV